MVKLLTLLENVQLVVSEQSSNVAYLVYTGVSRGSQAYCELVYSLVKLQLGRELVGLQI